MPLNFLILNQDGEKNAIWCNLEHTKKTFWQDFGGTYMSFSRNECGFSWNGTSLFAEISEVTPLILVYTIHYDSWTAATLLLHPGRCLPAPRMSGHSALPRKTVYFLIGYKTDGAFKSKILHLNRSLQSLLPAGKKHVLRSVPVFITRNMQTFTVHSGLQYQYLQTWVQGQGLGQEQRPCPPCRRPGRWLWLVVKRGRPEDMCRCRTCSPPAGRGNRGHVLVIITSYRQKDTSTPITQTLCQRHLWDNRTVVISVHCPCTAMVIIEAWVGVQSE